MDPKNGKKHRDKKQLRPHQQYDDTTTNLIIDDEHSIMQNHCHDDNPNADGSNSSSSSSDHLNQMANSKKKWKCVQCTYENWPSALKCTLCLHSKTAQTSSPSFSSAATVSPRNSTVFGANHNHHHHAHLKKNLYISDNFSASQKHSAKSNTTHNSSSKSRNSFGSNRNSFNQIEIADDQSCAEMSSTEANTGRHTF